MAKTISHNGVNYEMRVVSSSNYGPCNSWLSNVNICDSDVISARLEKIALDHLQDDDCYGFFISDDNFSTVKAFVIIDGECTETSEKVEDVIDDISKCAEITLFCSNQHGKIPGLATKLFNYAIDNINEYLPNRTTILLVPANKRLATLIPFYERLGFERFKSTPEYTVMKYDLPKRGGNKKQRKTRRRRKSIKFNKRHKRRYTKKNYSFR